MHWGNKILVSFVLFVAVMFTMVYISVNTEFSLVSENYYEQELVFQDQIDRQQNVLDLEEAPEFQVNRAQRQMIVRFPEKIGQQVKEGKVKFYRASDARYDQDFDLKLNEKHEFALKIDKLLKGAWKVQLTWTDGEKEYYKEMDFVN